MLKNVSFDDEKYMFDGDSLCIDVWQSGVGFPGRERIKQHTGSWMEDFDTIYDWNTYNIKGIMEKNIIQNAATIMWLHFVSSASFLETR